MSQFASSELGVRTGNISNRVHRKLDMGMFSRNGNVSHLHSLISHPHSHTDTWCFNRTIPE